MDPNNNQPQPPQSNDTPNNDYSAPLNPAPAPAPAPEQQAPESAPVQADQQDTQNSFNNDAPTTQPQAETTPVASGENPGQTLGIVGIVLAFFFAPAGIVLGVLSRKKSKAANHSTTLGTVALILSIVFTVLGVLLGILYAFAFAALINSAPAGSDGGTYEYNSGNSSLYE